jgi:HEAT repeat protein
MFWAWRHWVESSNPDLAEARSARQDAMRDLHSRIPSERVAAINLLERLPHRETTVAIPPITAALDDPEVAVRVAAAEALGSICGSAVASGSMTEAVKAAAAALLVRLKDPVGDIRFAAARSLGKIAGATPPLRGASPVDRQAIQRARVELRSDQDPRLRSVALRALCSFENDPPEGLVAGLEDRSAEVRLAAIELLAHHRRGLDPWIPRLIALAEHDPEKEVREECLHVLRPPFFKPPAVTEAVVPALLDGLKTEVVPVRYTIVEFIGQLGPVGRDAIPELLRIVRAPLAPNLESVQHIEVLEDADPGSEAALALGAIAPGTPEAPQVIAALTEVARSGPLMRRTRTVYALGLFGPAAAEAIPVLIGVITDPTAVKQIQDLVGTTGKSRQEPDESAYVHGQAEAARALGKIAPGTPLADQAITTLQTVLNSPAEFCRAAAAQALGQFGPKAASALPRIRELKNDRATIVSRAAAGALTLIER